MTPFRIVIAPHPCLAHDLPGRARAHAFEKPVRPLPDHAPSQKLPGAIGCRLYSHVAWRHACARAFTVSFGGPSKAWSGFPCQHVKTKADPRDFTLLTKR